MKDTAVLIIIARGKDNYVVVYVMFDLN